MQCLSVIDSVRNVLFLVVCLYQEQLFFLGGDHDLKLALLNSLSIVLKYIWLLISLNVFAYLYGFSYEGAVARTEVIRE